MQPLGTPNVQLLLLGLRLHRSASHSGGVLLNRMGNGLIYQELHHCQTQ